MNVRSMATLRRDFVAARLRSQVDSLRGILDNIKNERADYEYATESLRQIEVDLRHIGKLCVANN